MMWNDEKTGWDDGVSFVEKSEGSANIFDFTTVEKLNETMRFETVSSLNFDLPKKGESIFMLTTKPISLLDVVNYIEQKEGSIDESVIYLYTINEKAARYITYLSKKTKLKIIISDIMNSNRLKEKLIWEILEKDNVDFVFVHSHAKIVSLKVGENHYILSGSMNAGTNARIESLQINNSKEMYDFIDNSFELLREKYSIKKRLK